MLEKRTYKERVRGQFHRTQISGDIASRGVKSMRQNERFIFRIQPEIAVIAFGDAIHAVGTAEGSDGRESQFLALFHQRASEPRNQKLRGIGRGLLVAGGPNAANIAGVFDERMLEAGAGSEKWHAVFASESDSRECAVLICVRAGGNAPDAVEIGELFGVAR